MPAKGSSAEKPTEEHRHPTGWLFLIRIVSVTVCSLVSFLFLSKIPSYYDYLKNSCLATSCEYAAITPLPKSVLEQVGLSDTAFAVLYTGIALFFFFAYFAAAALILVKRPSEPISYFAATALIAFATPTFISMQWRESGWLPDFVDGLSLVSFVLFLLLFPNGRFIRPWVVYATIGLMTMRLAAGYFPDQPWGERHWPLWLTFLWLTLQYVILIYSQYTRYRYTAGSIARQQTKWVVYGILTSLTGVLFISVFPLIFQADFYEVRNPVWMFLLDLGVQLFLLPIPLTLGISILRKRLWDIDPLVSRTLVYLSLTAIIIALYSLTVWYLSLLFHTGQHKLFSLFAAGFVAVIFAPLKEKLQLLANRMLYGQRHDPYTALMLLGNRLKETLSPMESLDIVVQTVKDSLRIPYAGIGLIRQDETVIVSGTKKESADELPIPLSASGSTLGWLYIGARSPGEAFNDADHKLMGALARQAGIVVQSVKQSVDIQLLLEHLQESKEALIFAREEERRAMRRNLHDDIAPRLAAMRLTASAATDWIRKDPDKAIELMARFKKDIGETVDEIREIVYNLRPHALDEFGLVGAIRQRVEQLKDFQAVKEITNAEPLYIQFDAPERLPILPAAIEVGAYRIASEALVNVVKHARADSCRIRLEIVENRELVIEVMDNGIGMTGRPANASDHKGIGLTSLRERALELGGTCVIENSESGQGTTIVARLPIKPLHDRGENQHVENITGR